MRNARRGAVAWGWLFGCATVALALATVLMPLLGTLLARYDLISKLTGFEAIVNAGYVVAGGVVCGAVAVVLMWRKWRLWQATQRWHQAAALGMAVLVCAGYVGFLVSRLQTLQSVPVIHDISTDLQDPPAFVLLANERAAMPEAERPNWRALHQQAYGDVQAISLQKPVATLVRDIARLAQERGWQVISRDSTSGVVEATASVSWIRFQDDVVIRVRAVPGTPISRVDMRSRSRVGASDLGTNAKRVREFLQALAQAAAAPRLELFAVGPATSWLDAQRQESSVTPGKAHA
jgi:uncharacterized protein (DUF1499 family)